MNNRIIFISILLTLSIWSCKKDNHERTVTCFQGDEYGYLNHYKIDSMCTSEICTNYLNIWEKLFKEKNNLNETFFEEHIVLCQSSLDSWNEGITFRICYKVQFDWAIAYNCDKFMIKINDNSNLYPDLPRNKYLSQEEIKLAIDKHRFYSQIATVSNSDIKFTTMNDAINKLKNDAGVNTLCMSEIYLDDTTGDLILEAWAEYENEENSCIKGKLDLINGDIEVVDTPCVIFEN